MARACELVVAAGNGDLAGVRKAVEKGARVTDGNYDKRTALHTAAAEGKIPVVRRLVEEMGAKVNAKDRWEGTPLDDACRHGHRAVCDFLIAKGAINGKTMTPPEDHRILFNAIAASQPDCIRSLVRRKVDVNMQDADKRSAMHVACASGSLEVVKILHEECKANLNLEDRLGGRPIDDALRCNYKDIAEYMRHHGAQAGKAIVNTEAAAALCDAASKGDIDKLRELRSSGVDVNCGDYDMRTAMHLAASEGILPVIEVLVNELGGNQNVTDRWGGTPLDDAIRSGHSEIQEWLELNSGVTGEQAMFQDEASLLCDAASKGDFGVFRGMAKQNADLNCGNIDGRTALHICTAEGHMEAVKVLVEELNADVNQQDRWGRTALDDAKFGGHNEIVDYLKSHGATAGETPKLTDDASFLINAVTDGDLEELRRLVTMERNVNSVNFDQRTALHVACSQGKLEIAQALMSEFSANVNAVDMRNGTPLDDALEAGFVEVVELLQANGAKNQRVAKAALAQEEKIADQKREVSGPTQSRQSVFNEPPATRPMGIGSILTTICCAEVQDADMEPPSSAATKVFD